MKIKLDLCATLKVTGDSHCWYGKACQVFPRGAERPYFQLTDYIVSSALSGPSLWLIPR